MNGSNLARDHPRRTDEGLLVLLSLDTSRRFAPGVRHLDRREQVGLTKVFHLSRSGKQEKHLRRQRGRLTIPVKSFEKRVFEHFLQNQIGRHACRQPLGKACLTGTNGPFDRDITRLSMTVGDIGNIGN